VSFQTDLGSKHNVIVDGRASKRDVGVPVEITVESSFKVGDRAKQIDRLLQAEIMPSVFVDAQSNIWRLTAGGSGLVVFESADDKPLDEYQENTVEAVVKALESEFGIKKPKKKKKEQDVLLGVVEPEYVWPEIVIEE
jgi:hypothetical protein